MTHRLRRLIRYPKFSLRIWLHRMLFWGRAVLVALAAMLFERTSSLGNHLFGQVIAIHPALADRNSVLSLRLAAGKVLLTSLG